MASADTRTRVLALWRDPALGLTGLTRLKQKLAPHGISLSTDNLEEILASEPSHTLYAHDARAKKWNTITETGVGHGMQMDLMDMGKIATRNKNFYWILCIIDIFSRYAWAFPLKRKT